MLELVDSLDLKSSERKLVRVRVPPRAFKGLESRSATARGGVAGEASRPRPVTESRPGHFVLVAELEYA